MGKIVLGVIVGFIVWTVLWLGGNALLAAISPGLAFVEGKEITGSALVVGLVRSIVASLLSGFAAVLISKEIGKTTLYLGILLLLVGIFFQYMAWNLMPVWYHFLFLFLLIPVTIFGGKLKKS